MDPRWGSVHIGQSKSDIHHMGCTLTAIADLHSKFYYKGDKYLRPDEMAKKCTFVPLGDDPEPQYLIWKSIEQFDIKFVWRQYFWRPKDSMVCPLTNAKVITIDLLKELSKRSDYGVLIQLELKNGMNHWVAMESNGILGLVCNDPNGGVRRWTIPYPYKRISGFSIIKKSL
jgi:hypothetical protein